MLPVLEGLIRRRILLNLRVDPELVRPTIPEPLELNVQHGYAIVGVCLIGLEQIRPKALPAAIGLTSENMAHRVAVRFPVDGAKQDGVFVWRRDTDQRLVSLLGGRLFPGVQGHATFAIDERENGVTFDATTGGGEADVAVDVDFRRDWRSTPAFGDLRRGFGVLPARQLRLLERNGRRTGADGVADARMEYDSTRGALVACAVLSSEVAGGTRWGADHAPGGA